MFQPWKKEEILCLFIFFRFQPGPFLGHQGEVKLPWTKCLPSCGHLHKRYTTSQSRRRGRMEDSKNLFQIVKGTNKLTNQHIIWNKWYYSTYNSTYFSRTKVYKFWGVAFYQGIWHLTSPFYWRPHFHWHLTSPFYGRPHCHPKLNYNRRKFK